MKRFIPLAFFILLCSCLLAFGQSEQAQTEDDAAQQPHAARPVPPTQSNSQARGGSQEHDRYRYDPAAPGPAEEQTRYHTKESGVEHAVKNINKANVDYGGILATWRIAAVQETIESLYFWIIIVLSFGLMSSMAYAGFLLHQRQARLLATGGIIAQLWNAQAFARLKALEATEAHNKLAELWDAKNAEEQKQLPALPTIELLQIGPEIQSGTTVGAVAPAATIAPTQATQPTSWASFQPNPTNPTARAGSDRDDGGNAVPLAVRAAQFAAAKDARSSTTLLEPEDNDGDEYEEEQEDIAVVGTPETAPNSTQNEASELAKLRGELAEQSRLMQQKEQQLETERTQRIAQEQKVKNLREVLKKKNEGPSA